MRTGITFIVSAADRERVTALINDRNAPQKRLACADHFAER